MIPNRPSEHESRAAGGGQPVAEVGAQAAKLIGLKRYETPGEEYFERFLKDFQERQRSELLRLSVDTLLRDRFSAWVDGVPRMLRLALAGAAAVIAFAAVAGVLRSGAEPSRQAARPVVSSERTALADAGLIREF